MCSICTEDTKNNGKIPIALKYLDLGKNVLIHLSILPDFITKSSIIYPAHITKNPILIEKNATVNLNNVGLPVFLNPLIDIIPITSPTKNPTKFSMFSNRNSNDV